MSNENIEIIVPKGSDYERTLTPAGNHIARCVSMVHIGTIKDEYMGQPRHLNKIRLGFELPLEKHVFNEEKGEQPFMVYKEYTMLLGSKSNLRKDLESWRGKAFTDSELEGFNIAKLLGVEAMVNVTHKTSKKGNSYEQISSITPIPKGMNVPEQINETFVFNYNGQFDNLDKLPEFLQDKIKSSEEYLAKMHQSEGSTQSDEENPADQQAKGYAEKLPF